MLTKIIKLLISILPSPVNVVNTFCIGVRISGGGFGKLISNSAMQISVSLHSCLTLGKVKFLFFYTIFIQKTNVIESINEYLQYLFAAFSYRHL